MRVGVGLPTTTPGAGGALTGCSTTPFDPFAALAAAAAVTERIRLATMIVIGPLRPAAMLIKDAASVQALSGDGSRSASRATSQATAASAAEYRRGHLTGFSDQIRGEAQVRTLVGGYLDTLDAANTIVGAGRSDLCLLEPAALG